MERSEIFIRCMSETFCFTVTVRETDFIENRSGGAINFPASWV